MFVNGPNRATILDRQYNNGVNFGDRVVIEPYAVIYDECSIGDNTLIGAHAVLRPRTTVEDNSIFGTSSVSEGDCYIGKNSTIHAQCHITAGMKIGNNVFIAPFFIASNTPDITTGFHGTHKDRITPFILHGNIEDNVRIGIRVSVVPGIKIGHDSLIYQNCLITKDVEPYSIMKAGVDQVARKIGTVDHE